MQRGTVGDELLIAPADVALEHDAHDRAVAVEDLLDKIRQAGMAKAVGVSNYTPSMINEAVGLAPIAANEIEYHPYLSQDVLIDLAHKHDHAILAYCPLARGGVINDPVLNEIGVGYGKSASQVALRWLVQQERVVVLPRSSKLERVEENAQIFDFELTDEEMAQIRALDREERLVNPKERVPDWERG